MHNEIDKKILGNEEEKKPFFNWYVKVALPFVMAIVIFGWFKFGTMKTIEVTIANTDSKDGVFLVFTDKGTFKNVDSYWHFKFDSSDVQGMAAPGTTVKMRVYGIRSGMASSYKNILSIEK